MTNSLAGCRNQQFDEGGWNSTQAKVDKIFHDVDPVARQAVHDARAEIVQSLHNWAGSTLNDKVQEVVTHARHSFQFIIPTMRDTINPSQHAPSSFSTLVGQDPRKASIIRRARVFLDGTTGEAAASLLNTPPPSPIPDPPDDSSHELPDLVSDDLLNGVKPVSEQFLKLREKIISFAKFLDTYPGLTQQRELRPYTLSGSVTDLPWVQLIRKQYCRESVIWAVLHDDFDFDTFGLLKNYDDRLSYSKLVYGDDDWTTNWKVAERNQW
ncbi:hypothetical protein BU23DRAFT_571503 [Bimuria novae-zelandiae CBS 107.79]|uniref:Uncharacterized protein n=1 Tax=Bimuria novae-zelandiae CBS 107.79 TaxID=1447943 RepID=A0A6A5UXX9_9PLEO|nr:hypothetical protein BU23DRAFT_571503 [Bimuria novae-zelandiae CBS 107.79]